MHPTITITLLMALLSLPASAAMYKWNDANGETQYGQFPPTGVNATRIKADPKPKSAPARKPLEEQVKELDKQMEQQKTAKEEATANKQNAGIREQNCENARSNMTKLGYGGQRLAHMPDGSYERISEEKKQDMLKKNQDAIKEFCD